MSSPAKAQIAMKSEVADGLSYIIRLYHYNEDHGVESHAWTLIGGQTSDPSTDFTVHFDTGAGAVNGDRWWAMLFPTGSASGTFYVTGGDLNAPEAFNGWAEYQLEASDANQRMIFQIDTGTLHLNLKSGSGTRGLMPVGRGAIARTNVLTNIFVLMLENHSFDNIFALSGIPGINHATTADANSWLNVTYNVAKPAPAAMTTDPGHEFPDVVEQLCGHGSRYSHQTYPPVTNSGFASNYAVSVSEKTGVPSAGHIGDIMACFDTPAQLPVIYQLATEFAVCDNWFSSMPGPTWPNRYFLHGATSAGLDRSPTTSEASADWFEYPNGSIFDRLEASYGFYGYRLYNDTDPTYFGGFAQVASIEGISGSDVHPVSQLKNDLKYPYPYPYTFIEPNYGDTFQGGSSQHPMDSVARGEALIKSVYEAIRNSPVWGNSLLIVTYDEHGGFYDHVAPPRAVPPGDNPDPEDANVFGFNFAQYGVRVPALLIGPFIKKGGVDSNLYDHSSVPKTLAEWLGMKTLTARDAAANPLPLSALSPQAYVFLSAPRTDSDCPATLNSPAAAPEPLTPAAESFPAAQVLDAVPRPNDHEPLPLSGNIRGFLQIAVKTDLEMAAGDPPEQAAIRARAAAIGTRGEARAYMIQVRAKVDAVQARRNMLKLQKQ